MKPQYEVEFSSVWNNLHIGIILVAAYAMVSGASFDLHAFVVIVLTASCRISWTEAKKGYNERLHYWDMWVLGELFAAAISTLYRRVETFELLSSILCFTFFLWNRCVPGHFNRNLGTQIIQALLFGFGLLNALGFIAVQSHMFDASPRIIDDCNIVGWAILLFAWHLNKWSLVKNWARRSENLEPKQY